MHTRTILYSNVCHQSIVFPIPSRHDWYYQSGRSTNPAIQPSYCGILLHSALHRLNMHIAIFIRPRPRCRLCPRLHLLRHLHRLRRLNWQLRHRIRPQDLEEQLCEPYEPLSPQVQSRVRAPQSTSSPGRASPFQARALSAWSLLQTQQDASRSLSEAQSLWEASRVRGLSRVAWCQKEGQMSAAQG